MTQFNLSTESNAASAAGQEQQQQQGDAMNTSFANKKKAPVVTREPSFGIANNQEEWFDSQEDVDTATEEIRFDVYNKASLKVIQTFRHEISMNELLSSLAEATEEQTTEIQNMALTGVPINEATAAQLSEVLKQRHCTLSYLQLNNIRPEGIVPLCQGLRQNSSLREIRFTFKKDMSPGHMCLLFKTLKSMYNLETVKLFRLAFTDTTTVTELADMVRGNHSIEDLRIKGCDFDKNDIRPLVNAIHQSNSIRYLDLSENSLSDYESLSMLFQTASIQHLHISDNKLGESVVQPAAQKACDSLKYNTTLRELYLDMNPMSVPFAKLLQEALEYNTTLTKCWCFMPHLPSELTARIQHLPAVNEAGRKLLRQEKTNHVTKQIPYFMARLTKDTSAMLDLLLEDPMFFVSSSSAPQQKA